MRLGCEQRRDDALIEDGECAALRQKAERELMSLRYEREEQQLGGEHRVPKALGVPDEGRTQGRSGAIRDTQGGSGT